MQSSDPLPNASHEAFAQQVASGKNATQAYTTVYGTENRRVASTGGHRLLRRKSIAARIKAIQQAGADGVALDLREIHDFLTRVVRTPAGQVTPSSDLCTRVKQTRDGSKDVWMPDKLACLKFSAKLQGFLDSAGPARTARPAQTPETPTQSDPLNPWQRGAPRVMTEEYRAVLIARKRADSEARIKRLEERRLAAQKRRAQDAWPADEKVPGEEQRLAEEGCLAEERPIFEEEHRRETPPPRTQPAPSVRPQPPAQPAPPAWVGPSGRQPYFGQAFRSQPQPETRNEKPETSREAGQKVSNSHHPAEPTSRENQEPNLARPVVAGGANQTWPGEAERRRQPSSAPSSQDRMSREAAHRLRLTGDGCTSDALLVLWKPRSAKRTDLPPAQLWPRSCATHGRAYAGRATSLSCNDPASRTSCDSMSRGQT